MRNFKEYFVGFKYMILVVRKGKGILFESCKTVQGRALHGPLINNISCNVSLQLISVVNSIAVHRQCPAPFNDFQTMIGARFSST